MSELILPSDDDVPLVWARFYRAQGFIPLPIRSNADLVRFRDEYALEHPRATETEIEEVAQRKRKHPMCAWGGGRWVSAPPDDYQIHRWWAEDPERGIFLLTGTGAGITVIDVDPDKGGDGTLWEPLATIVTSSPRGGGYHLWFDESAAKTDNDQIGPGIDVRGVGGGFVAPSGTASPGRHFLRFGLPLAPYPATMSVPAATPAGDGMLRMKVSTAQVARAGSFAEVVGTARPDGTKNSSAKVIVGMLCRPASLPADAVDAALSLLDAGHRAWPTLSMNLWRPAWEAVLAAPAVRPESFVVQFVQTWNALRGEPPWPQEKAAEVASSLWRTASREQALSTPAAVAAASFTYTPAPSADGSGDEDASAMYSVVAQGPTDADLLRHLAPLEADIYTADDVEHDRLRELLSCAVLPGNLDMDGRIDHSSQWGNGWGPWLDDALGGGIAPGYFLVLVAKRAKAGKTAFMDQFLTGLGMSGASAFMRKHEGPILQPWILTEMSPRGLIHRGLARYIGADQSIFRRGRTAKLAPGIMDWAKRDGVTPEAMAVQTFQRAQHHLREASIYTCARRIRRFVNVRAFPEGYQRGPKMLQHLAALIRMGRAHLAAEANRSPAEVWPVLFVDPLQRFGDESGSDGVQSGDAMLEELRAIVDDDQIICIATSDTNKSSASEGKNDDKLPPDAMVAKVSRGTYKIGHVPDAVIGIDVCPLHLADRAQQIAEGRELEKRALLYVGLSRWSEGSDVALPFRYFPRSGRFVAIQPVAAPKTKSTPPGPPPPPPAPGPATLVFTPKPEKKPRVAKGTGGKFTSLKDPNEP